MPAIPQILRAAALKLPDAQESIACKGTAAECVTVQAKKKNFLFLKRENEIMLKLRESIPEAERLDLAGLAADIQRHGRRARMVKEVDAIVQLVALEMRPGDVVAILSNGGFGGIYEKLPQRLKSLSGSAQQGNPPLEAQAKA